MGHRGAPGCGRRASSLLLLAPVLVLLSLRAAQVHGSDVPGTQEEPCPGARTSGSGGKAAGDTPGPGQPARGQRHRPNFVVFLMDDLDNDLNSTHPHYMPALHEHIVSRGVTFRNWFVTTPVCCPSRVNLLRGQLSHNTNFTDVLGPHGGYKKFKQLGLDTSYLPLWLLAAGYGTYYTGKFIVDYTVQNCGDPPAGWTDIDALVTPFLFNYYHPAFSRNGARPVSYPDVYSTDVVASKAVAQVRSAVASGLPFYLQVNSPAPHKSIHYTYNPDGSLAHSQWFPPLPAPRHFDLFPDAPLPRLANFNEDDVSAKPLWVRDLHRLTGPNVTWLEEVYRMRLRSLRAADEMIGRVVQALEDEGVLRDTYLVFTSDNGYHFGSHRQGSGKLAPYEEDIRVPFFIAGPGLQAGRASEDVGLHVDVAPTILALAGAPAAAQVDGTPLPLSDFDDGALPPWYPRPSGPHRNQFGAEFWGPWFDESISSHLPYLNLTWKAVRVAEAGGQGRAYKYMVHCSGERELYDLRADPQELRNLFPVPTPSTGRAASSAKWLAGLWQRWHGRSADNGVHGQPDAWAAAAAAAAAGGAPLLEVTAAEGGDGAGEARSTMTSAAGWQGQRPAGQGPRPSRLKSAVSWLLGAGGARRRGGEGAHAATGAGGEAGVGMVDGVPLPRLLSRLDALLGLLAVCRQDACVNPFKVLHPEGGVETFRDALAPELDPQYDSYAPFYFKRCLPYQDVDNEVSPFRDTVAHFLAERHRQERQQHDDHTTTSSGGAQGQGVVELLAGCRGQGRGGRDSGESEGPQGHGHGRPTATRDPDPQPVTIPADVEQEAQPLPEKYFLATDLFGAFDNGVLLA